jgi:hypothetical protein
MLTSKSWQRTALELTGARIAELQWAHKFEGDCSNEKGQDLTALALVEHAKQVRVATRLSSQVDVCVNLREFDHAP